jgi:DNA polymerase-1
MYKLARTTKDILQYIGDINLISADIETSPDESYRNEERAALDPHKAHITGISFSVSEGTGVYVPLAHKIGKNFDNPLAFWTWFAALVHRDDITLACHNLAFESVFFYARGIIPTCKVYDTIAAAQMTLKGNTGFRTLADSGLKTLVPALLDMELPSFSEVTAGRHFDELDPADCETIRYACADSDYTLRLYHVFNNWFDKWLPKHRTIVEQIESPTAVYCGLMKYNGLLVDAHLMEQKAAECEAKLAKLREDIAFIVGDVNIGANASTSAFTQYL